MALKAAFAEVDITPTLPIEKVGWLMKITADTVLDPIYAHVLVLDCEDRRVAFVSLDVLSIRWTEVERIRAIGETLGIPAGNLLVAATHNHAGPAVISLPRSERDVGYCDFMIEQIGAALQHAVDNLVPAKLAVQSCTEGRISFIRRYRMKDGSTKTHPRQRSPEMRCAEGVIDPEVGVLCVKDLDENVLGFVTNFTCHPTHHGGDTTLSAGWPGQLSLALKRAFGPAVVNVFLNGAFGDVHHANPMDPNYVDSPERMADVLTTDIQEIFPAMTFTDTVALGGAATILKLPYRDIDGPDGRGAPNRQRFEGPQRTGVYDQAIEVLARKKTERDHALAQVQCLRVGADTVFLTIPAEYFCGHGLRIKIQSPVANTYVVGAANGMVGYVPMKTSFPGGGYETTLALWSKLAPEAGDLLADAAIELAKKA